MGPATLPRISITIRAWPGDDCQRFGSSAIGHVDPAEVVIIAHLVGGSAEVSITTTVEKSDRLLECGNEEIVLTIQQPTARPELIVKSARSPFPRIWERIPGALSELQTVLIY
jgi:hypothetical protein